MTAAAVASGQDALAWIRAGHPVDVAILDMQMPEMDGLAATQKIHRLWPTAEQPYITHHTSQFTLHTSHLETLKLA
jgi:CheY-like chemotaxis protein